MKILLNGKEKKIIETTDLNALIQETCKKTAAVIAEVNGRVIKTPLWKETIIKEGDKVELVRLVGGG